MKLLYTIPRNGDMLSTFHPPLKGFMPETDGQKLERFLARAEMPQKELAAKLKVEPSYISRMVNDRVGWVRGRYFGQIASLLRLTDDEIRELNPAAVITVAGPLNLTQFDQGPYLGNGEAASQARRSLPDGLIEAIQKYGSAAPDLLQGDWQQYLAGFKPRGEDKDADEWYDFYRNLVKFNVKPGDPN